MKNQKWYIATFHTIILFIMVMLTGCSFIGGVFKTGLGLGALVVIVVLALILFISRSGKKNV
jgi:hypothetical protein